MIFAALLFQGGCSLLLAALFEAQLLEIWILYVFGALISVGFEFSRTAEIAVVPIMFRDRRVEATAGLASAHTLMFIAGPTMAGFLLGFLSYEALLWINAASYLGPILMCIWSRIPNEKDLGGIRTFRSVVHTIGEGMHFLRDHRVLKSLLYVIRVAGLVTSGIQTMILYYLKNDFAASDAYTSWVIACSGLGLFVGSLLVPRLKHWLRNRVMLLAFGLSLLGLLLFLIPNPIVLMAAQIVLAVGIFTYSVTQDILIQDVVPNQMMGRVGGLIRMISHITLSLSTALLGWVAGLFGAPSVFLFASALTLLAMLIVFKGPLSKLTKEASYEQKTIVS